MIKKKTVFESDEHEKGWFIRVTINCSKNLWKNIFKYNNEVLKEEIIFEEKTEEEAMLEEHLLKLPTRSFHIEVSKLGYPYDCVVFMSEDEMKSSVINGIEMNIGARVSYGSYENPDGYYNYYYAEFYNDEIYYKINAENLAEREFINILRSLVS